MCCVHDGSSSHTVFKGDLSVTVARVSCGGGRLVRPIICARVLKGVPYGLPGSVWSAYGGAQDAFALLFSSGAWIDGSGRVRVMDGSR
jgi:hypothetical protein